MNCRPKVTWSDSNIANSSQQLVSGRAHEDNDDEVEAKPAAPHCLGYSRCSERELLLPAAVIIS